MEKITMTNSNWKEFSVLTNKKIKENQVEITGYSAKKLEPDTKIYSINGILLLTIIQETERRNAQGEWNNGEEINRWFKAIAIQHSGF